MSKTNSKYDKDEIARLRADGLARGWPISRIVEAIVERFGVTPLEAHRLARSWNRRQAVDAIRATYTADGLRPPSLTTQRLFAWERSKQRPGEDYLDRLCRVYETRADLLGYGRDYTRPTNPAAPEPDRLLALPAAATADGRPNGAYAGAQAAPLTLMAGEHSAADPDGQQEGEEEDTNRTQFLLKLGASGMAVLVGRAADASAALSLHLEESNAGPVTIQHLQLQVANFLRSWEHTPNEQMFREVFDQRRRVAALLDGRQPLAQRCQLYRIAGQLTVMLAVCSFNVGDYRATYAHCLTAEQLARETSDDGLLANVRVWQSTAALWDHDLRMALHYAQDAYRYAPTPATRAEIAVRCEARAWARMHDRSSALDAVRRARSAMSAEDAGGDPRGGLIASPMGLGSLELYTGITLLWLDQPDRAEQYARGAIAYYQKAPPALTSSANQSQAQINLAICLAAQDQPDEGLRLASEAIGLSRGDMEANLQQAGEFLAALKPAHRNLPAARDFAEQLRVVRIPPQISDR